MSTLPILIVEDDSDAQEVVARLLQQVNHTVDLASSAEEAITRLQTSAYAAVIIDLALPGMDGFQLIHHIRTTPETRSLPCIAVTAFHTPELKIDALDRGFDAYFAKPLNRTLFLGAIADIVSG